MPAVQFLASLFALWQNNSAVEPQPSPKKWKLFFLSRHILFASLQTSETTNPINDWMVLFVFHRFGLEKHPSCWQQILPAKLTTHSTANMTSPNKREDGVCLPCRLTGFYCWTHLHSWIAPNSRTVISLAHLPWRDFSNLVKLPFCSEPMRSSHCSSSFKFTKGSIQTPPQLFVCLNSLHTVIVLALLAPTSVTAWKFCSWGTVLPVVLELTTQITICGLLFFVLFVQHTWMRKLICPKNWGRCLEELCLCRCKHKVH